MLTLLPVILLLLSALVVFTLRFLPRGTGYAYLTSIIMMLIIWGGVLASHWLSLTPIEIAPWRPFDPITADPIRYGWDEISWPFSLALVSACLAILMTASARLQLRSNPATWAANMGVAALGILVVMAETPLAFVLALVPLDTLDFLVVLRLSRTWRFTSRGLMVFVVKSISTFLIVGALVYQRTDGFPLEFSTMNATASLLVLLAIGIRLGLLPLNLTFAVDIPFQRGLISFLRVAAYAGGLAALARMSSLHGLENWHSLMYGVMVVLSLYGASMWLSAHNEIEGRQYWLLTTAGLGFLCVLQGNPLQVLPWGLMLIFGGTFLFLFSARGRNLVFLPILATLMISGLPFSIPARGWSGLFIQPVGFGEILVILTTALTLAGFIKHAFRNDENFSQLDGWVRGTYPLGLILLIVSGWVTVWLGIEGGMQIGPWLIGLAVFALAAIFTGVRARFIALPMAISASGNWASAKVWWSRISGIFRLTWLSNFLWFIYRGLRRLVSFLTILFEGEGGVLWAFLLLALMLTLLATRTG